jgi:nitroreductase
MLCAGVVGVAAVKLLLRRGDVKPAPYHHHFDPYIGKLAITWLPLGMNGPLQRAKLAIARRMYLRAPPKPVRRAPPERPGTMLESILTAARWAPSGDNQQPWRFEVTGEDSVKVHLLSEAATNPYEYRGGRPSFLSLGMLLESLKIAASAHGRTMEWRVEQAVEPHVVAVSFPHRDGIDPDPLLAYLSVRSVDRRPYLARKLTASERSQLETAAGPELSVRWFESAGQRWQLIRLGAKATDIRLRARETFEVHQKVIDWANRYSPSGIPAEAIGLDRATLKLMRWAMASWDRMQRLNRLAGTGGAALQLDVLPGVRSAAFFALLPRSMQAELGLEELIRAGQGVQRFWLTATRLGLALQPAFATLIFGHNGAEDVPFTTDQSLREKARKLARAFQEVFGHEPAKVVFLGRIGEPPRRKPGARSVRRPLAELTIAGESAPMPASAPV